VLNKRRTGVRRRLDRVDEGGRRWGREEDDQRCWLTPSRRRPALCCVLVSHSIGSRRRRSVFLRTGKACAGIRCESGAGGCVRLVISSIEQQKRIRPIGVRWATETAGCLECTDTICRSRDWSCSRWFWRPSPWCCSAGVVGGGGASRARCGVTRHLTCVAAASGYTHCYERSEGSACS